MNNPPDSFNLLSKSEMRVLERPENWKWISSAMRPEVRPARAPKYRAWWSASKNQRKFPQREYSLLLSGTTYVFHKESIYPCTPGVVALYDRYEMQAPKHPDFKSFKLISLHFSNRHILTSHLYEVDSRGDVVMNLPLKFMSENQASLITDVWTQCFENPGSPVRWAFLKSVVTSSFFEALTLRSKAVAETPQQSVINSVCEYIEEHLDRNLSLEHLAGVSGYSPWFFHRLFMRYTGKTLHNFIIEARLRRAKALLREGHLVQDAGERVGMASASYFSRFFRKHTRMTPSGWRAVHYIQK